MKGKGETSPVGIFIVGLFLLHWFSSVFGWDYFEDFFEDFPLFPLMFGFVLFRLFSVLTGKNKRGPVPMPTPEPTAERPAEEPPKDLGFEIPPLRGAPKEAQAEAQETQEAEEDDEALDALRRDSYERHLAEKQERERKMEEERLRREHQMRETQTTTDARRFSPDALRNAIIWSEILGKPKALRRR